jgi:hypothetical protein
MQEKIVSFLALVNCPGGFFFILSFVLSFHNAYLEVFVVYRASDSRSCCIRSFWHADGAHCEAIFLGTSSIQVWYLGCRHMGKHWRYS